MGYGRLASLFYQNWRDEGCSPLVLKECPFCHRPFEAELVSKEQIDSREVTKQRDVFFEGSGRIPGTLTRAPLTGPEVEIERIADHPEAYITNKLTYRCKHCGKEWTKLSVEEVGIPKEYVEDEEEKTEYDAEQEAKEAREEEYAREEQ